jgi:hypothetical protein
VIAFVFVYVSIVVMAPLFCSVSWIRPQECDLVYLLTVSTQLPELCLIARMFKNANVFGIR